MRHAPHPPVAGAFEPTTCVRLLPWTAAQFPACRSALTSDTSPRQLSTGDISVMALFRRLATCEANNEAGTGPS